jgi:hypothetical protein
MADRHSKRHFVLAPREHPLQRPPSRARGAARASSAAPRGLDIRRRMGDSRTTPGVEQESRRLMAIFRVDFTAVFSTLPRVVLTLSTLWHSPEAIVEERPEE